MSTGTGDVTTDPIGRGERTCGNCSFYERLKNATPCNGCKRMSAWTPKPQLQGAPLFVKVRRCEHGVENAPCPECDADEYRGKYNCILAAIQDDALMKKVSVKSDYLRGGKKYQENIGQRYSAIYDYRVAVLERINAKQPEPYSEERHADVGMIEEQQ